MRVYTSILALYRQDHLYITFGVLKSPLPLKWLVNRSFTALCTDHNLQLFLGYKNSWRQIYERMIFCLLAFQNGQYWACNLRNIYLEPFPNSSHTTVQHPQAQWPPN